jgi:APA family basic amino acid/polyamine antiporter
MLIVCALLFVGMPNFSLTPAFAQTPSWSLLLVIAAAMGPVMFSYGGWHTASFVAAEMIDPKKDLARGVLYGVLGVVFLYLSVNLVCVGALGAKGLSEAGAPASAVMRLALGERGARLIAVGITISTLGFLSQGMLTAPRVYFAMAEDKLFFKQVARIDPRTQAPFVAIILQGVLAGVIVFFRKFNQIVDYVVSVDFIAYGLTATCLIIFRRRDRAIEHQRGIAKTDGGSVMGNFRAPGHPFTTLFFTTVCWAVVAGTVISYPENTVIGLCIVLAGVPIYFFWRKWRRDE